MLMYGYVAKWKSRFVGWVALLSIIGEFVALSGVVGGSYVRLSAFFIFGVIGFVAWALMLNSDMMEEVRPVPDEFYKPLGAFNATVRGVAALVAMGADGLLCEVLSVIMRARMFASFAQRHADRGGVS